MILKKMVSTMVIGTMLITLVACGATVDNSVAMEDTAGVLTEVPDAETNTAESDSGTLTGTGMLDTEDMFTARDLEQKADVSEATTVQLENNNNLSITEEGVYILTGEVTNSTVVVEADDAKVQLVLDGVHVTNESLPVIYVKSADKVWVTSTDSSSYMEVAGDYSPDGDTNLDAVIFSKDDLVINGVGSLEIVSATGNGITSKDDLKITGGTLTVDAYADGLEANDSIRFYDGLISIVSDKDAIHSENDDDLNLGYIYIQGGELNLTAGDDAIRGNSIVQIDGGTVNITYCIEGIEGTYVLINDGTLNIYSTDDGINASGKSDYDVVIEINGGNLTIDMASGDTDAIDSNGDIYVNGGVIDLTCGSSFDVNGNGTIALNGGDITVNGESVTDISSLQQSGGRGTKRGK